ncbi:MAG: phage major capsid protein [Pseudomonadota bacterium]
MPQNTDQSKERLADYKGGTRYRSYVIDNIRERDDGGADNRTFDISFSSDTPYYIWGEYETLGHKDGECNLERLSDKAALLLDHNRWNQIGVVEKAWIEDGKGRAVVRFSKNPGAEEIYQDVLDGIRTKVSVGYSIQEYELIKEKDGIPEYRVTKWTPHEISIVSVPADTSVGTDRSYLSDNDKAKTEETSMPQKHSPDPTAVKSATEPVPAAPSEVIVNDTSEVREIFKIAGEMKALDIANEYVQRTGEAANILDFQTELLNQRFKDSKPIETNLISEDIGLTNKERKRFSLMNCIRALKNPGSATVQQAAAFEREVSEAAQQRAGYETEGFFIPDDIIGERTLTAAGEGAKVIDDVLMMGNMIGLLRNNSAILPYCTFLNGLVGNVTIPKEGSDPNVSWVSEGQTLGESDVDFGNLKLSPKKVGSLVPVSSDLLRQTSLDIEALIAEKIIIAIALGIDRAAIYGDGITEPLGIIGQTGLAVVDFDADYPTHQEILSMKGKVASANAQASALRFLTNSDMLSVLEGTQKFNGTDGSTVYNPDAGTIAARTATESNQFDNGDLLYANLRKFIFARWGGIDLMVDPYTGRSVDRIKISAYDRADFGVENIEAFCLGRKVT